MTKTCEACEWEYGRPKTSGKPQHICGKDPNYCEACEAESKSCPVCGYYCKGKGGVGCIHKPSLRKIVKHICRKKLKEFHTSNCQANSLEGTCTCKEPKPSWEEELSELGVHYLDLEQNVRLEFDQIILYNFIRQTILKEREQAVRELLDKIKKELPKKREIVVGHSNNAKYIKGWNKCLKEVKTILEKYERGNDTLLQNKDKKD